MSWYTYLYYFQINIFDNWVGNLQKVIWYVRLIHYVRENDKNGNN